AFEVVCLRSVGGPESENGTASAGDSFSCAARAPFSSTSRPARTLSPNCASLLPKQPLYGVFLDSGRLPQGLPKSRPQAISTENKTLGAQAACPPSNISLSFCQLFSLRVYRVGLTCAFPVTSKIRSAVYLQSVTSS